MARDEIEGYKLTKNEENEYIYLDPICMKHEFTLIFLHGLTQSAQKILWHFDDGDFTPKNCRIVLPTAPVRKVSKIDGREVTAWYDVYKVDVSKCTTAELVKRHNQE